MVLRRLVIGDIGGVAGGELGGDTSKGAATSGGSKFILTGGDPASRYNSKKNMRTFLEIFSYYHRAQISRVQNQST